MHSTLSLSLLLIAGLVAGGCGSSMEVLHRGTLADWHQHRTYAVGQHPVNGGSIDPLLRRVIGEALEGRGYRPAEAAEQADIVVSYVMVLGPTPDGSAADLDGSRDDVDAPSRAKSIVMIVQEGREGRILWTSVSATSGTDRELRAKALDAVQRMVAAFPRARPEGTSVQTPGGQPEAADEPIADETAGPADAEAEADVAVTGEADAD